MEILEVIRTKMDMAQHVLRDLIKTYPYIDDTARIEKANLAFDNVQSYLQIEQNLLFPYIRKTGEHDDILDRAQAIQDRIDELLEKAVMVHVDEPDNQFYYSLDALLGLMEQAERVDNEAIFPWARVYLTEADHYTLITRVKDETLHETVAPMAWQKTMFRQRKKGFNEGNLEV